MPMITCAFPHPKVQANLKSRIDSDQSSVGLTIMEFFSCFTVNCAWVLSHVWLFVTLRTPLVLPGSSVHRILQARILEWVAISSSRRASWPRGQTQVFCISCIAGGFFAHWAPSGKPICLNYLVFLSSSILCTKLSWASTWLIWEWNRSTKKY